MHLSGRFDQLKNVLYSGKFLDPAFFVPSMDYYKTSRDAVPTVSGNTIVMRCSDSANDWSYVQSMLSLQIDLSQYSTLTFNIDAINVTSNGLFTVRYSSTKYTGNQMSMPHSGMPLLYSIAKNDPQYTGQVTIDLSNVNITGYLYFCINTGYAGNMNSWSDGYNGTINCTISNLRIS